MRSNAAIAFEPEAILPGQLLGNGRLDSSAMPEKRLLLAVLEEAVVTFQRYVNSPRRRGQRLFREGFGGPPRPRRRAEVGLPR